MAEIESNPFRPGGEYYSDAEKILRNSTICRDKVIINDPSIHSNGVVLVDGDTRQRKGMGDAPPSSDSNQLLLTDVVVKSNNVKVNGQPSADIEHVKIKKSGLKCCLIS